MAKFKISIIIALILIISGSFITLDLITAFEMKNLYLTLSLVLKALIVFLTTLLVFLINNRGISKGDTSLLKIIFIFIIIADLTLVLLKKPYMGIIVFFFVQLLLIYRNSYAIYKQHNLRVIFDKNTMMILILLMILLFTFLLYLNNHISDLFLFILFLSYGLIKSFSVLAAGLTYRFKVFPKTNRLLLFIGVVCFYLCDLNVGLNLAFNSCSIKNLSNILIWIFYTPALTLIALSGYDFRNP